MVLLNNITVAEGLHVRLQCERSGVQMSVVATIFICLDRQSKQIMVAQFQILML
jgi:hypothetical protein